MNLDVLSIHEYQTVDWSIVFNLGLGCLSYLAEFAEIMGDAHD